MSSCYNSRYSYLKPQKTERGTFERRKADFTADNQNVRN